MTIRLSRWVGVLLLAAGWGTSVVSLAGVPLSSPPPHLSAAGRADFEVFKSATGHKAFALAPGGTWGWVADAASAQAAQAEALSRCAEHTEQTCVLHWVDQQRVFAARRWPTLWRLPKVSKGATDGATVGLVRGATFPNLAFASADGRSRTLAEWRGQVVVLHFWGSWCPPCRSELPDMAAQAARLSGRKVVFIPLQVRESIADARRWITAQGITLTLYDSGMKNINDGELRIAGGGRLPDRAVAPVFPSTVVLDQQGRVVFTHRGPIETWAEYAPFLRDLAR